MKKVAILQSNYIPWKGYFDLIAAADEFIIYDDMQFTRRSWRNRNLIKTPRGIQWLTVPVQVKGKYLQKIKETQINGHSWNNEHWKTLSYNYRRAPFFNEIADWLAPLYLEQSYTHLSTLNLCFIKAICTYLEIKTLITHCENYVLTEGKAECLLNLCLQSKATEYISGPAAKSFIDENLFLRENVKVTWFDYCEYPEYPQLWSDFVHEVSILDVLFNCGKNAAKQLKYLQ